MKAVLNPLDGGGKATLDQYINQNRLLILHYLPGYITPNEFFHRLFLAVHQLKKDKNGKARKLMLVFNSLDHIALRMPLCAKEDMFVAGIVEFLLAESVTSIFTTGEDTSEQHGILPMSDVIVSFVKYFVPEKEGATERCEKTLLRVEKIAGGTNAGKMGFLTLTENTVEGSSKGLHFKVCESGVGADWERIYKMGAGM